MNFDDDILDLDDSSGDEKKPLLLVTSDSSLSSHVAKQMEKTEWMVTIKDHQTSLVAKEIEPYQSVIIELRVIEALDDVASIRTLRTAFSSKPIIVLTRNSNPQLLTEVFKAGATDCVDADYSLLGEKLRVISQLSEASRLIEVQNSELLRNMAKLRQEIESRKIAELERANARDQLSEATKLASLGEMAGSIAHEINTPLAVVMGMAEMLVMSLEDGDPDTLETAQQIQKMAERIDSIIKGLKTFSRKGEEDPFETVKIIDVVNETLALCQDQMEREGITFSLEGFTDSQLIDCRPTQLSQVILNCLSNARHAVANEELKQIKLSLSEEGENFSIKIADSGHGVAKDHRDKIMEAYFTTKPAGIGTGLGLSISKKIAAAHHGKLSFEDSGMGNGTAFVFTLPKKQMEVKQQAS